MTQLEALDILKCGHNVYLTGSAGSGKTFVLNQYINYLKHKNISVAVTASTGIAATHIGGMTIHSWSGLGIKESLTDYDLEFLEQRAYLWKRFSKAQVLVIDEISMLHGYRLDMINKLLKYFKRNSKPFGGMQVVLCGDFFQLPPIHKEKAVKNSFAYHAAAWKELNLKICYLEEQHRQTDSSFLKILQAIRANDVTEQVYELLQQRYREYSEPEVFLDSLNSVDSIDKTSILSPEPTRLYTHNVDVDTINDNELEKIDGRVYRFLMQSRGAATLVENLKKSCLASDTLLLKKGAKVMFIKNNQDLQYVNGTLGVVSDFKDGLPVVVTASGKKIITEPAEWTIEEDGKVKAEISQLPLRLAWAITVHKSQGMSLDAVEVDLSKSFERGMGYVALSRVTSLKGLTLLGLNDIALNVNEEVVIFDKKLQIASQEARQKLNSLTSTQKMNQQEIFLQKMST